MLLQAGFSVLQVRRPCAPGISMGNAGFRHWVRTTLQGHIVGIWIYFSCPGAAVLLLLNYQDGTLNIAWALYIIFAALVIGAGLATVLFYVYQSGRK